MQPYSTYALSRIVRAELVGLALFAGANPNATDNEAYTAGHYALWDRRRLIYKKIQDESRKRKAIVGYVIT